MCQAVLARGNHIWRSWPRRSVKTPFVLKEFNGFPLAAGGTFFQNPVSKSYQFSNDATTLTLAGASFNIVYGAISNRVAQSFVFSGASNAGCAVSATGFIQ
jgi:hypothetical protein